MFEIKAPKNQVNKQPARKVHKLFEEAQDEVQSTQDSSKSKLPHLIAQMSETNYQKMLDETSKHVLEDPTIYSYDAHYDEINEKRREVEEKKRVKVGPKYIHNIQKTCEKRKIEQSMIYEKIAEKELQREGKVEGGQKYVTSSYKRLMEDGKKFQEEDAAKEQYNKLHTAENQDNKLGLYKDLYQQDIFMGGYRPDLSTMIKQDKNPEVSIPENGPQSTHIPDNSVPAKPEPQTVPQSIEQKDLEKKMQEEDIKTKVPTDQIIEKQEKKSRSHSRSRSRSKSPSKKGAHREEAQINKEKEKELTKEEKLKLAKERYQQRKLNQTPGPQMEKS